MPNQIIYRTALTVHVDDELDNWLNEKVLKERQKLGPWGKFTKAGFIRDILRQQMKRELFNA